MVAHIRLATRLFTGVLTALLLVTASSAFAANEALVKLLGIMRDRGTITAQEYNDLVLLADPAAVPAPTVAPPPAATAKPAQASPETIAARVQAFRELKNVVDEKVMREIEAGGAKPAIDLFAQVRRLLSF